jgi:hypothetical protein
MLVNFLHILYSIFSIENNHLYVTLNRLSILYVDRFNESIKLTFLQMCFMHSFNSANICYRTIIFFNL